MLAPSTARPQLRAMKPAGNAVRSQPAVLRAATRRGAATTTCSATATDPIVSVRFSVPFQANFGEGLRVVGSHECVGAWDPAAAPAMMWSEGDIWVAEVEVPAGAEFEYKLVYESKRGLQWETSANRALAAAGNALDVRCLFNVDEAQVAPADGPAVTAAAPPSLNGASSNGNGVHMEAAPAAAPAVPEPVVAFAAVPAAEPVVAAAEPVVTAAEQEAEEEPAPVVVEEPAPESDSPVAAAAEEAEDEEQVLLAAEVEEAVAEYTNGALAAVAEQQQEAAAAAPTPKEQPSKDGGALAWFTNLFK